MPKPSLVPSTPTAPASTVDADATALRAWLAAACEQYRGPGMLAALRALALASLCPAPVNVLLVGPPGTAKTSVSRAWARATGASFLGRTLSPWTDAVELLGAVDIAALQTGRVERLTASTHPGAPVTLTDADLVLLDELPRSAPGIRAMCLSALSDRVTPDDRPVAAHVILAGANTRLTSEEDRAIADRFHLRVEVPRLLSGPDVRAVMFRRARVAGASPTSAPLPSLPPTLVRSLREHAATVDVPEPIAACCEALVLTLRTSTPSTGAYPDVSDRRWETAALLLCASAALAGRSSVDWTDITDVMPSIVDDGPETRASVRAAIDASVPKWVRAVSDLDAAIEAAVARAQRVGGVVDARPGDGDGHAKVDEEFDALLAPLSSYGASVIDAATTKIDAARDAVADAYTEGAAAYAAQRAAARRK